MAPKNSVCSIRYLIRQMMESGEVSDYGNWGICTNGEGLYLGRSCKKIFLCVPLLDIVDHATRNFPEYGTEEMFVTISLKDPGLVEWRVSTSTSAN